MYGCYITVMYINVYGVMDQCMRTRTIVMKTRTRPLNLVSRPLGSRVLNISDSYTAY